MKTTTNKKNLPIEQTEEAGLNSQSYSHVKLGEDARDICWIKKASSVSCARKTGYHMQKKKTKSSALISYSV